MKIVYYLKKIINKLKNKKQNQILLDSPKGIYKNLINSSDIDNIINKMPKNLSKIEKAYYVYLELGKILSENPEFVFNNREEKERSYNDVIDSKYYGICKSISELYVSILKDKRIGNLCRLSKRISRKYTHTYRCNIKN